MAVTSRAMLLAKALNAIGMERTGDTDPAEPAVQAALQAYEGENLAGAIWADVSADTSWLEIAEFLSLAVWRTPDNGAAIHREAEFWLLQPKDSRQVMTALHLEAYPFIEMATMERVLTDVAVRFPEAAARCHELIESRKKQS